MAPSTPKHLFLVNLRLCRETWARCCCIDRLEALRKTCFCVRLTAPPPCPCSVVTPRVCIHRRPFDEPRALISFPMMSCVLPDCLDTHRNVHVGTSHTTCPTRLLFIALPLTRDALPPKRPSFGLVARTVLPCAARGVGVVLTRADTLASWSPVPAEHTSPTVEV